MLVGLVVVGVCVWDVYVRACWRRWREGRTQDAKRGERLGLDEDVVAAQWSWAVNGCQ